MPRHPKPTLSDVLRRPALNGGWDKLARQQDEQLERLERLEAWITNWDTRWKWLMRGVGAITVSVAGRLAYDLLAHVQIVLH